MSEHLWERLLESVEDNDTREARLELLREILGESSDPTLVEHTYRHVRGELGRNSIAKHYRRPEGFVVPSRKAGTISEQSVPMTTGKLVIATVDYGPQLIRIEQSLKEMRLCIEGLHGEPRGFFLWRWFRRLFK